MVVGRGLRRPELHTQHLPVSSAEDQIAWNSNNSTPPPMTSNGVRSSTSPMPYTCIEWRREAKKSTPLPHYEVFHYSYCHTIQDNLFILTLPNIVMWIYSQWGGRDFPQTSRLALGAHPTSYTMSVESVPGAKRPERGVDHQPYLALKLKKEIIAIPVLHV